MAYDISAFITQASTGGPVLVTKPASNTSFLLQVGGRSIILADNIATKSPSSNASSGVTADAATATNTLDLGTLFTADQVLASASLRQAIITGALVATAGTVALSKVPTTL